MLSLTGRALRPPDAVEEDGDSHVAEDVGGGPAAVREPIDGQEDWDLLRRQMHRREDQGQGDVSPEENTSVPEPPLEGLAMREERARVAACP